MANPTVASSLRLKLPDTRKDSSVVCAAPVADLSMFHKKWPGSTWTSEFGDPENPDDAMALGDIDPLAIVCPAKMPAVLVSVGEDDARVPPWHGEKLIEAWRTASSSPGLSILRYESGTGHLWDTLSQAEDRTIDELAFFSATLGLSRNPDPGDVANGGCSSPEFAANGGNKPENDPIVRA